MKIKTLQDCIASKTNFWYLLKQNHWENDTTWLNVFHRVATESSSHAIFRKQEWKFPFVTVLWLYYYRDIVSELLKEIICWREYKWAETNSSTASSCSKIDVKDQGQFHYE